MRVNAEAAIVIQLLRTVIEEKVNAYGTDVGLTRDALLGCKQALGELTIEVSEALQRLQEWEDKRRAYEKQTEATVLRDYAYRARDGAVRYYSEEDKRRAEEQRALLERRAEADRKRSDEARADSMSYHASLQRKREARAAGQGPLPTYKDTPLLNEAQRSSIREVLREPRLRGDDDEPQPLDFND